MADIGDNLRIKFGLINNPTAAQQASWASVTEALIRQGSTPADAGWAAAKQVFPDFRQRVYLSEGDTIEFLLRRVNDK